MKRSRGFGLVSEITGFCFCTFDIIGVPWSKFWKFRHVTVLSEAKIAKSLN